MQVEYVSNPKKHGKAPVYISYQRGASLLEGIAFLGIAAIVILGAVSLLLGAFGSANTNRISEEIQAIRTGVRKLYMGQQTSYSSVSNVSLAAARVFPTSLAVTAGGIATNAWGGTVTVAVDPVTTGNFTILYTLVPRDVCINAVSAGGDWVAISVNANPVPLPVTPANAVTACTGANNDIIWTSI